MDNHGVVFHVPFFDPLGKTRRVTVAASAGAKRMSRNRKFAEPWISRRVERNNFHLMAAIVSTSGLLVVQFTADKTKLREALLKIHPNPAGAGTLTKGCPEIS